MALVDGTNTAYTSDGNKYLWSQRSSGMEMGEDASKIAIHPTNIQVYSNDMRIGFCQSCQISENRTITPVQELGSEGVVQMVPGNTNGGSITMQRFAVYNSNFMNALGLTPSGKFTLRDDQIADPASKLNDSGTYGNPFKTLKDQRTPIEVKIKTVLPSGQNRSYYIETYIDCWLERYSRQVQSATVTISESATIQYSDVMAAIATEG